MGLSTGAAISDPFEFPAIAFYPRHSNLARFSFSNLLLETDGEIFLMTILCRHESPCEIKGSEGYSLSHQPAVLMEWGELRKHCLYELYDPCQFML